MAIHYAEKRCVKRRPREPESLRIQINHRAPKRAERIKKSTHSEHRVSCLWPHEYNRQWSHTPPNTRGIAQPPNSERLRSFEIGVTCEHDMEGHGEPGLSQYITSSQPMTLQPQPRRKKWRNQEAKDIWGHISPCPAVV